MRKRGTEVRPGDVIVFMGREHLITSIEPYTVLGHDMRIARTSGRWSMTLSDTVGVEIANPCR